MSVTDLYPPAYSGTYVKATTYANEVWAPYYACDPSAPLTGSDIDYHVWVAAEGNRTNQRFHIDLGSTYVVSQIQYNNWHYSGGYTDRGLKNFTFWGSNNAAAFAELTYSTDTNWTQLTTGQSYFDQHSATDVADTKSMSVTTSSAYRYYAFKIADVWGNTNAQMQVRHLRLRGEAGSPGWTHISKSNGIATSGIAKCRGIAVAGIAKVNGIAV